MMLDSLRSPLCLALAVLPLAAHSAAAEASLPGLDHVRRVVFLGDSITYSGQCVEDIAAYVAGQYPTQRVEFLNLGLPSETVAGLSEPGHAGGAFPRPCLSERLQRALDQTQPDLVVACYGMNDGIYYPFSEERFQKFQDGVRQLRERVAAAGARLLLVTPSVFDPVPIKDKTLPAGLAEYRSPFVGYNEVLDRYSAWLLAQGTNGWDAVDTHGPMNRHLAAQRLQDPAFRLAPDGVHIDATGHWLVAQEILRHWGAPAEVGAARDIQSALAATPHGVELLGLVQKQQRLLKDAWLTAVGHKRPGMKPGLPLAEAQVQAAELEVRLRKLAAPPVPTGSWNGYDRHDFPVGERTATVIAPRAPRPGRPWAWKGEFLDAFPATEIALLDRGFHVVYLRVPDMLGCPSVVKEWDACYREVTARFGLAPKVALIALSRAGLYCYNWAAATPDKVACVYADAAVCDFKSWPGGKSKGKGSPRDWQLVLERYAFPSEAAALSYAHNPIDELAPLAAANVPLLHVYGDADDAVPWEENTSVMAERYRKLGGRNTLIPKPGVGHHPHGLPDPTPIVDFIVANSVAR